MRIAFVGIVSALVVSVATVSARPMTLLEVSSEQRTVAQAGGDSPTGGSGQGQGSSSGAQAASRFIELVQAGDRALGAFLKRKAVDRSDADLRAAVECFRQALSLRAKAGVTRADVGSYLNQPDLEMALIHYYLGNHGAALACLQRPLAQGVPQAASLTDADRIRAQLAKAKHLHGRLTAPYLSGYEATAQRSGYTCGPTAVYMQLAGMGVKASLTQLEAKRDLHDGELDKIASDGVEAARAAGAELDAAWTEQPVAADREVGIPGGITLERVRDVISRGYPVVLAVRGYVKPESGAAAWTNGHYVLAIGAKCDARGRVTQVFTVDSDGGVYRKFDRDELQGIWEANQLGLIVLTPRSPLRRFRARLGVSTMYDGEAAARRWVGRGTVQSAD